MRLHRGQEGDGACDRACDATHAENSVQVFHLFYPGKLWRDFRAA
jgi:hypothetical protein